MFNLLRGIFHYSVYLGSHRCLILLFFCELISWTHKRSVNSLASMGKVDFIVLRISSTSVSVACGRLLARFSLVLGNRVGHCPSNLIGHCHCNPVHHPHHYFLLHVHRHICYRHHVFHHHTRYRHRGCKRSSVAERGLKDDSGFGFGK